MNPEVQIAIPSFKRSQKLQRYTLAFLEKERINKGLITIFVANAEEEQEYRKVIGDAYKIVVGVKGISQQRLFIRNYYPEGMKVISLDDDIKDLKFLRKDLSFPLLCERMFAICEEEGLTTWGIYPVNNLFFCKDRVLRGRLYIIGVCYGFINKHDIQEWLPQRGGKEDSWYSLQRIAMEGGVLRYDGCCPNTIYYAKGGLSDTRTLETEDQDARLVAGMFPVFAEYRKKKNGHGEVKIKRFIESEFSIFSKIECQSDTIRQDTTMESPTSNSSNPS